MLRDLFDVLLEIVNHTREIRQVNVTPLIASVRRCDDGTNYVSCGPEIAGSPSPCSGEICALTIGVGLHVCRCNLRSHSSSVQLGRREYSTLNFLWSTFKPKLVFAAEGGRFERALSSVPLEGIEVVTLHSEPSKIASTHFSELESSTETGDVDRANREVGPDSIAKVMFTSGSTGNPKGVINTQQMLCSNQEMIRSVMAFLQDATPVLCDWLLWNHTFGGNHNFGIALHNGGTLYIDGGKPTADQFHTTVLNLRDVSTTAYFNVPKGYEMLASELQKDRRLRERFFHRLQLLFCAAAPLGQTV